MWKHGFLITSWQKEDKILWSVSDVLDIKFTVSTVMHSEPKGSLLRIVSISDKLKWKMKLVLLIKPEALRKDSKRKWCENSTSFHGDYLQWVGINKNGWFEVFISSVKLHSGFYLRPKLKFDTKYNSKSEINKNGEITKSQRILK